MRTIEQLRNDLKSAPSSELIRVRAQLLSEIRKFEKDDLPSDAWLMDPSPDRIYLNNLSLLAELCRMISDRYTSEHNT